MAQILPFDRRRRRHWARWWRGPRRPHRGGSRPAPAPTRRGRFANLIPVAVLAAALGWGLASGGWAPLTGAAGPRVAGAATAVTGGSFGLCRNGWSARCVIDGDTIRLHGEKIRLAGIDAPETWRPDCASERRLGERATRRLLQLVNAGPFELRRTRGPNRGAYGRKLRVLVRDGTSLGRVLVAEGLARPWTGRRRSWCR